LIYLKWVPMYPRWESILSNVLCTIWPRFRIFRLQCGPHEKCLGLAQLECLHASECAANPECREETPYDCACGLICSVKTQWTAPRHDGLVLHQESSFSTSPSASISPSILSWPDVQFTTPSYWDKHMLRNRGSKEWQLTWLKTFSSGSHVSSCSACVTLCKRLQQVKIATLGPNPFQQSLYIILLSALRFAWSTMQCSAVSDTRLFAFHSCKTLKKQCQLQNLWLACATYNVRYVVCGFPSVMLGCKSCPPHSESLEAVNHLLAHDAIDIEHVFSNSRWWQHALGTSRWTICLQTKSRE